MKILLVQNRPAIRLYKLGWTLRGVGHTVAVAHKDSRRQIDEHRWLAEGFHHVPIRSGDDIATVAASADLIVQFDSGSMARRNRAMRRTVTFVGDLMGLREQADTHAEIEGAVLRDSLALMFISPEQQAAAAAAYGPLPASQLVVHNGPVEAMLASPPRRADDGRIHVVYSGMMQAEPGTPRDIVPLLDAVVALPQAVLHVIPGAGVDVPAAVAERAASGRLVLEKTVPSRDLIGALHRFDVGLVYVDEAFPAIRDTMRPNKLYEYLAAGLAVVANDGVSLRAYLRERNAGVVFETLSQVPAAIEAAAALRAAPGWPPPIETWEAQASQVDAFLRALAPPPPRLTDRLRARRNVAARELARSWAQRPA